MRGFCLGCVLWVALQAGAALAEQAPDDHWSYVEEGGSWQWFEYAGLHFRTKGALQPKNVPVSDAERVILRDGILEKATFLSESGRVTVASMIFRCKEGTPIGTTAMLRDTVEAMKRAFGSATSYQIEDLSTDGQEISGVSATLRGKKGDYSIKALAIEAGDKVALVTVFYYPKEQDSPETANHVLASVSFQP